ncbi:MAG: 16S rRNA (guanine(966)-N(2))-methyltransferase RsmD [Candidatus Sumerlaeia bacterium]
MVCRITAGRFKGRLLKTPKGQKTRPSNSRVREALFNILGQTMQDYWFYDFYAGSGAMGLEALSRGARGIFYVESSRSAMQCLKANLRQMACRDESRAFQAKLPAWLRSDDFELQLPACFFIDPPYREGLAEKTMTALAEIAEDKQEADWTDSVCAVQAESGLDLPERFGPWSLRKKYSHGDTALFIYDYDQSRESQD